MQKSFDPRSITNVIVYGSIAIAFFIFLFDRATKLYFQHQQFDEPSPIISGLLDLIAHQNYGIVANAPLPMWAIVIITIIVIACLFIGLGLARLREDLYAGIALGLVLGGAFGNFFDRLYQGYVFDWILLFGQSAINIADISIIAGALLYFFGKTPKKQST